MDVSRAGRGGHGAGAVDSPLSRGKLDAGCSIAARWLYTRDYVKPLVHSEAFITMRTADQILDESFLTVRAKLLEVAATLDRIDRSADEGSPLADQSEPRRAQIDDAIRILLSEGPDRAERLQRLYSREYEADWRSQMQL